ncbi:hypothetical protein BC829DRAFT_398559 [Chytridium lagenaria]|nr:hypothetical protein BC829DRAFT_398559 [Chytridium lagenaria]
MPSFSISPSATGVMTFTLHLTTSEKAAAVQFSDISFPLSQITLPIEVNPTLKLGFRVGTHIPGVLIAGSTFYIVHPLSRFSIYPILFDYSQSAPLKYTCFLFFIHKSLNSFAEIGNIYHWKEQRDFYYVGSTPRSVGIGLSGNSTYARIVFDVEQGLDPQEVAQKITEAVQAHS